MDSQITMITAITNNIDAIVTKINKIIKGGVIYVSLDFFFYRLLALQVVKYYDVNFV